MSELILVTIPGGGTKHGTVARVLVVPRLTDAHGLADWPAIVRAARFTLLAGPDPAAVATEIGATVVSSPDSEAWRRMFATCQVRPWSAPRQPNPPDVTRSASHVGVVRDVYAASARQDPNLVRDGLAAVAATALPPVDPLAGAPDTAEPDFHRLVALFREHPAVLRALGLIVELAVPDPAPLAALSGGVISVRMTAPDGLAFRTPHTRFEYAGERFLPAARPDSDIVRGLVDLGSDRWTTATFDVLASVNRLAATKASTDPTELPPLRSAGLSLLRHDRGTHLGERAAAGRANATVDPDALELWADDLVLGYRVDVRHKDEDWQPLCRRTAAYQTADGNYSIVPGHEEEGHVKANGATVRGTLPGLAEAALTADETVVRWNGWSLVCRPPGAPVPDGETRWLRWQFAPIGLPTLRFAGEYRMRIRVADLAGGGLELDEPDLNEGAAPLTFYPRHDPVPPPEVVAPAADPGPGGSTDTLVIRSDPAGGLDVERYAAVHPYPANDERMLLPPPAAFALCDQHGAFPPDLPDDTFAAWWARAAAPHQHTADGAYSWLPDPAADGVAIIPPGGSPNDTPTESWAVPHADSWPDFHPKYVRLAAGPGDPVGIVDGVHAVARLDPGRTVVIEVASSVVSAAPFAVANWLSPHDEPFGLITPGLHPDVSPRRALRLIHAVQHPLCPPAGTLTAARDAGRTDAVLVPSDAMLGIDAASTGQLDVDASWPEFDPFGADQPQPLAQHVGSIRIDPDTNPLPAIRHEFGDTRHRTVRYRITATSRYRDFFDLPDAADYQHVTEWSVPVQNTARPDPPTISAITPAFRWTREHAAGAYRAVRGGGLIRVELAKPWLVTGEGEQLGVVLGAGPAVRPLVSKLRRDPIWPTPLPPHDLDKTMFRRHTTEATITADGVGGQLTVLGFDTRYDPTAGGRWFADVEIVPDVATYCPFAELAVVRFQQCSVDGCAASQVVRAEPVPLLPDRTLTVRVGAGGLIVRLDGIGPAGSRANRVTATPETLSADQDPAAVEATRLAGSGPGWRPGTTVTGDLNADLPPIPTPAGGDHTRLVVQEIEPFTSADGSPLGQRVVFLDIVPLPV